MSEEIKGRRVAVLVANEGIEQIEMTAPIEALKNAGAQVRNHLDKGDTFRVDHSLGEVNAGDYAALMLPGGVANPDQLRTEPKAVQFVTDFFSEGKPVAAICHAPWTLVEAGVVKGRTMTSWPSLKTDIENAGGTWVDEEVHVDQGLVTSRNPDDLDAFCSKMVEEIAEGRHAEQTA